MKNTLRKSVIAALALGLAATVQANPRQAILIAEPTVDQLNSQEKAAAEYFQRLNNDGVVIAPGETSKIDAQQVDVIWIHIDRLNVGKGNLPAVFDEATINALKQYLADGGNLLLTKHATQLVARVGRVAPEFDVNIYGDGDGGNGTDNWEIMAQIGYDNIEKDPSQYYDRRNHPIYAGLTTGEREGHEVFPLLGTNGAGEMWREDHNCKWDFNAYNIAGLFAVDGANTVEKFEKQTNSVVLGAWGHVKDYACAGIIEFKQQALGRSSDNKGVIIANGLAAYELAPRNGGNAFQSNIEKLTANSLNYLSGDGDPSGITDVEVAGDSAAEYFNLQGVRVAEDALSAGLYIKRQGNKSTKVIIK